MDRLDRYVSHTTGEKVMGRLEGRLMELGLEVDETGACIEDVWFMVGARHLPRRVGLVFNRAFNLVRRRRGG